MSVTDEIIHVSRGYRWTAVYVSIVKRALQDNIPDEYRLAYLEWLDRCHIDGQLNAAGIAAIQPMCDAGDEIYREARKLGTKKCLDIFAECDVFRSFVALNPSLLTALEVSRR
ncbi:hypothetical protein CSIRO_2778 [Bradyrhizobiaceae bacterium SG-6C]|nr:hypothetical protein CSIRO_2778 [Bradyrhizobiaceae bacterium SG-6C]